LPIGLELGPLVRVQRVLDGEFVQVELNLKLAQIPLIGGFDADPDEVVGSCRPLTAFLDGDVGYLAAVAVGSRGDYPAHRASLIRNSADYMYHCEKLCL
jgi:hypothetical protein